MSINVNLRSVSPSKQNSTCHHLPCKIDHRGDANVSIYFTPNIRVREDSNILTCSFRGRPLLGKEISVPEGHIGVVLEEKPGLSKSADIRDLNITGSFNSFTAWNWNLEPTSEDKLCKAFDWFDVACAIHQAIDSSLGDDEDNEMSLEQDHKRKRDVSSN